MSQDNVEIARRFSLAFERSSRAYWKNPRSLVAALQAGDLDPEGTELLSYLHPKVEWKTAFSLEGETHREEGYSHTQRVDSEESAAL